MTDEKRVPDLLVEQLSAGELPPGARIAVEDRLRREGAVDRVAALRQSDREILEQYPPDQMAFEIRRRAAREKEQKSRTAAAAMKWIPAAGFTAAAAILAVMFWPKSDVGSGVQSTMEAQPWVAFKGTDPGLFIHRKEGDAEKSLLKGETVRSGDVLQIACATGSARNAVIFSVDGAGAVTLHFPVDKDEATSVKPGGQFRLPFGYELDDAPGFERFFMVWVPERKPLDVARILAAAGQMKDARHDPLPLPAGLRQNDFTVVKSGREGGGR